MSTLTLARRRLRAHLQRPTTPRPVRLAHDLVDTGKGRWLPLLSSPFARDLLTRGYDPFALDCVYEGRTEPKGGLVARVADRLVLDLPLHRGLRERRDAYAGEIVAAVAVAVRGGVSEFRLLSAPCGLADEALQAAARLRISRPEAFAALRLVGVDSDPEDSVLREASLRARRQGVPAIFIREDLRRLKELEAQVAADGPFHAITCVGLTQRHTADDCARLLQTYAGMLIEGGTLLIDRCEGDRSDEAGQVLAQSLPRLSGAAVHAMLKAAGLVIEREHPTGEGGCVVTVARKP